ncbi:MAG: GDSL-type esterase/lipase family protein, partial [Deltaproteobacteria bacterium]|nr:GDSL-type esterase/lipase family protein [Deltaproteobacteria bacterium]
LVDGLSVGAVASYTFTNVTDNHTIAASFEADSVPTHTITATAGANGTITPSGEVTVNDGDDQVFNISPDTGYHIAEVLVDGLSVGAVASYTFTNVTDNHTIAASFEADLGSVIIDNGDPETSSTGAWSVSSAPGWHGTNSVWSRDGSIYRWTFSPSVSGYYDVGMWWTTWSSRSTNVPVIIEHAAGSTVVNINQQLNGSQWNSLDDYFFESGSSYNVTITAQPGPSSTCADAVRFNFIQSNDPPTAIIDYITPNPAQVGEDVTFSGYGEDPDGSITGYSWESNIDGWLSDLSSFTTSSLTEGTHTISFKVQDDEGIWSEAVTQALVVGAIPTEIIIDNRDAETSQTGTWGVSGATDPYGADSVFSRDGATFTWHFTPSQSGLYEVSMWWTALTSRNLNVPVDIEHSDGVATVYVDQQENGGQWNAQGHYYFESGTTYDITITSQPYPSSTCADAVKFSFITDGSFVEILEPSSYYLQTFPDLTVSAVAINLEPAWKIKFIIDLGTSDERSIIDTSEPYEVLFTSLTEREHTVHVFVVDGSNLEVPGTYMQDQIIQVGIGHYCVAIGDSITEGYGDDDSSDDISLDGRNSGPGYESILNNLLTDASNIPHTIVNEGMGGATSSDGRESILTILAKHSESQRFFVQFGTNDARSWLPVPSGKGLIPTDQGYPGTFKDNMQHIIDEINSEVKEVCLGKPPIALGDSTYSTPYANPDEGARNVLIKEYNEVIDELKNDPQNNIMVTPPDFYSLFNEDVSGGKRYDFEYADNLHPNNDGYHSMANHWLESLIP